MDSAIGACAIHALGSATTAARERLELRCVGLRSDHEPVPAGPVDRLPYEPVEPAERPGADVGVGEVVRFDVVEHRLFAEVVLDHRRDVRVDRFVVGDTVPDEVRDRDVAGPCRVDQAGAAQHRVGAEMQRIEVLVVDSAIDDVDGFFARRRAHEHMIVTA